MPVTTREWQLAARPHGEPTPDDFRLVEPERPDPGDGQVVVRMLVMSVDPYMRGRMNAGKSYAAAWEVGETMQGGAVGRVVDSRSPDVPEGALVLTDAAWRDVAVLDAAHVRVLPELPGIPPSYHLGVLGHARADGLGRPLPAGRRSPRATRSSSPAPPARSAAWSASSPRLNGASAVIGSAGTPEKVRWLTDELGFTAAFDYHDGPVAEQLAAAAPDGIDVFFDNVGGEHLEAAIGALQASTGGPRCAARSPATTRSSRRPARATCRMLVAKQLSLRGFIVSDHTDLRGEFIAKVTELVHLRPTWSSARRCARGWRTPSPRSSTSCAAATPAR